MHIVINAFSARRGGGKTYLRNLLNYCPADENVRVTLLISSASQIEVEHTQIKVHKVSFPVDNPFMRALWERYVLPGFLRNVGTDIFFCPGGLIPRACFGTWKTVTMFRNMIPFDIEERKKYPLGYMRMRNWLLSKSMLRSMENADLVIFISEFAKSVIGKLSRKGIKKSIVIPHGVSQNFHSSSDSVDRPPPFDTPYILYPSIIDVYKSQKEVVQAVAILRQQNIDLPKVLMVGEIYGEYGEEVKRLIVKFGLTEYVKLTGPVPFEDMPALYQNATFVIFASKSENCPNILLEAMAAGCPIICSNRMPMPEFGNEAVEYFDAGDPANIADSMMKLMQDNEYRTELSKKSYKRAHLYKWEDSAAVTWNALISIIPA